MPDYGKLLPIPQGINKGLSPVNNNFMLSVLGSPRSNYSSDCKPVTNPKLKNRMVLKSVGKFRVQGFDSAVQDIVDIFQEIRSTHPDLYEQITTAGMLCPRLVRGSTRSISNHSWGTAIDLGIKGKLVGLGVKKVQYGLELIAPLFNKRGWYWGAGFSRADSMHFEASADLIRKWAAGKDYPKIPKVVDQAAFYVVMGSRDKEKVIEIQTLLNKFGYNLKVDGDFGIGTKAAVIAFQGSKGLKPDGIVGNTTMKALKG